MHNIQILIVAIVCLLLTLAGCRTGSDNSFPLVTDDSYLDDSNQLAVDLNNEESAAELCENGGTDEHYFIRPTDGEDYPLFEIHACIDDKFNLKALDIKMTEDAGSTTEPKKSSIKISIPPEYVVGIFDMLSYQDSRDQLIEIVKDYDIEQDIPGFPPLHFYKLTINGGPAIQLYQTNLEDPCPREWFASDDTAQSYSTASGEIAFEAYVCQTVAVDGTISNLPLWMNFSALPEKLEDEINQSYRLLDFKTHSSRRNFRHEISIGESFHFVNKAVNVAGSENEINFYPSRIRDYSLVANSEPCDIASIDAEACLDADQEAKWHYSLVRRCQTSAPVDETCTVGEFSGEYYCHDKKWRCRHEQTSVQTHQKIPLAQKSEECELGEEDLFLPHCAKGLTCNTVKDGTNRCY